MTGGEAVGTDTVGHAVGDTVRPAVVGGTVGDAVGTAEFGLEVGEPAGMAVVADRVEVAVSPGLEGADVGQVGGRNETWRTTVCSSQFHKSTPLSSTGPSCQGGRHVRWAGGRDSGANSDQASTDR